MEGRHGRGGIAKRPVALVAAFLAAHVWLGFVGLTHPSQPFQDVTVVYSTWMQHGLVDGYWVGIDARWVYPFAALAPMLLAAAFGLSAYGITWLVIVLVLDLVALGVLTRWGTARDRFAVGWWWTAFLVLVGPIAVGRIDSITVPIAVIAVVLVSTRPWLASALLTLAAWMKIWPGALVLALVVGTRDRARILLAAAAVTGVVVISALALGSGANALGFLTEQANRGLQVEALVSAPWLWLAAARVPGTTVYYDQGILTYQVTGPGTDVAAALMTPVLIAVVAAIAALGVVAASRGASGPQLIAPLSLALVCALIAVNKVGSPQFILWLVAPVILGMLTSPRRARSSPRTPAGLVLVVAALTQLVYPYWYGYLVAGDIFLALVLTTRNILMLVLLAWAVTGVVRQARDAGRLEPMSTTTSTRTVF